MPITIDERRPELCYRVDCFSVPAAARAEFEASMRRNLAFLETLPGFLGHVVLEKTGGPSAFEIVTIATWESRDALERAGAAVRAYYARIGFDVQASLARWGARAELADYRAPLALQ